MCTLPRNAVFWSNWQLSLLLLSSGYSLGLWVLLLEQLSESSLFSLSTTSSVPSPSIDTYLSFPASTRPLWHPLARRYLSRALSVCLDDETTTVTSGHLCSLTWSICMFISKRILTFCVQPSVGIIALTLYVILLAEIPVYSTYDFIVSLLIFNLCQFTTFTSYVSNCLFSVLAHSAHTSPWCLSTLTLIALINSHNSCAISLVSQYWLIPHTAYWLLLCHLQILCCNQFLS